jgi:acyl-CoA dehydrogenase
MFMSSTTVPARPDEETGPDWVVIANEVGTDLLTTVEEYDRAGEISAAAFERLAEVGITRALVPKEFGGGGATHAQMAAILRELGRFDPATALTLAMHSHVVAFQVWRHNAGMDASVPFRKVVDEGAIFVSTGASDWVESNGTVKRVEGGFRVSAHKAPASGCEVATVAATSFRWEDEDGGAQVIHCMVPCGADGVSIEKTWDTLGMRATGSHTMVFEDVFVPDAAVALTRPAGEWPPVLNAVGTAALPLIMSAYVGVADAVVDEVQSMLSGRDAPHTIQLVGEMLTAHTTAADMVEAMLREADNLAFTPSNEMASRVLSRKRVAGDAVIECARLGIEASGGMGFMRSSVLERLYRDAHGNLFHPLPRAKQLQFTGRVGLGLAPYI